MRLQTIGLPSPRCTFAGRGTTVIEGLRRRRSSMRFIPAPATIHQLSRVLNEAAAVTPEYGRGAPSPGRAYALECYVAVSDVEMVPPGAYRYNPTGFDLSPTATGSPRTWLPAALPANQPVGHTSSFHVFIVAHMTRAEQRLGPHANELLLLEAGHLVQSMLLLAVSEGLGACPIARFDPAIVEPRLDLDPDSRIVHSAAFGIAEPQ